MRVTTRYLLLASLLSVFSTSAVFSEDNNPGAAELAKLEGTYTFVSAERNGEMPPPEAVKEFKTIRTVIKRNSLKFVKPGQPDRDNEFKIDATKSPKQIDLTGTTNDGTRKRTVLGIYSLEGKTLKLCIDDSGKERPVDFTTKGKRTIMMMGFERE